MNKKIEEIQEMVRKLRDADFHVCPNTTGDTKECTCRHFDEVIDKLEELKK